MSEQRLVSFAQQAKEEIANNHVSDEWKRSLLSSYFRINGEMHLSKDGQELLLTSESAQIAKLIYEAVTSIFGVKARFAYTRGIHFKKKVKYHVLVSEPDYVLGDLEVDYWTGKIPHNAVANQELSAAYLAGAFLASGSVNDPSKANYHLELSLNDESYAKWLAKLINKSQQRPFSAKVIQRRNHWICYLKKSEEIADFLILIGATNACLQFENVRVERDFQNSINRLQNLDKGNFKKTMSAAQRQLEEIHYFEEHGGLSQFRNPKIEVLMNLRLTHEDASLDELAELLSDELASTVSKSNVNHLFRDLHKRYLDANGKQ